MSKRTIVAVAAAVLGLLPQTASAQVVVQGGVQVGIPAPPVVYMQPPQVQVGAPAPVYVQPAAPGGYMQVDMDGDPTNDNMGYATMAPPQPLVEQPPPPPVAGYAWVPGYWRWRGNQYVWVRGRWMAPRAPGYAWNPGGWYSNRGRWMWRRGGWRAGGRGMVQPVMAQPVMAQPVGPAVVQPVYVGPRGPGPRGWRGRGRWR